MNIWKEMQKDVRSSIREIKEEPFKGVMLLFIIIFIAIAYSIVLFSKK